MFEQQHSIRDIMLGMRRCPQPVISVLQGAASGGGFALALASDVQPGHARAAHERGVHPARAERMRCRGELLPAAHGRQLGRGGVPAHRQVHGCAACRLALRLVQDRVGTHDEMREGSGGDGGRHAAGDAAGAAPDQGSLGAVARRGLDGSGHGDGRSQSGALHAGRGLLRRHRRLPRETDSRAMSEAEPVSALVSARAAHGGLRGRDAEPPRGPERAVAGAALAS